MELQIQIQTLPKITTTNKPPCPDNEIMRQQQKNTTISINIIIVMANQTLQYSFADKPKTVKDKVLGVNGGGGENAST